MPTNLAIDDSLLAEALRLGDQRTKRATVNEALAEYVQRRKRLKAAEAFGTIEFRPGYDYERARKKRCCFFSDDLQMRLFGHIDILLFADLLDLPFADLAGGPQVKRDNPVVPVLEDLAHGAIMKKVAHKHCSLRPPFYMKRRDAPAKARRVDNFIMD